ncbi:MAG: diguanylate cyclase [Acidobacteria bacterium]|nr:diguanylate cyclase [Acidobacteriota bacterium]
MMQPSGIRNSVCQAMSGTSARRSVCRRAGLLAALALCLAGLAGIVSPTAHAASLLDIGTYSIRVFRDSDGLPQNTVHAIVSDRHGFLWIGTQDGAAYYDGRRWHGVDMPNRTRSNFVRAILAAGDGSLWFATQAGGLHRYQDGRWTPLPGSADAFQNDRINALADSAAPDREPVIWAGTHHRGVARIEVGRSTLFDTRRGLPHNRVWGLYVQRDGNGRVTVWAGTEGGLARFRPDAERFEIGPGFPRESVNSFLETMEPDGSRALWVGTYGGGLYRFHRNAWRRYGSSDGLPSVHLTSLEAAGGSDNPQGIWIGTDGGGLAWLSEGRIHNLGLNDGLPSNAVYSLHETRQTTGVPVLWAGTRNGGLAELRGGQWRVIQPVQRPFPLPVLSLLETVAPDGTSSVWFGTDGGGLVRLTGARWDTFSQSTGALPNDIVQCLAATAEPGGGTTVWAGTRTGGLARFAQGGWRTIGTGPGLLPNDMIQVLLETGDSAADRFLWVGTRGGLARFGGGRWTVFDTQSGLPHNSVLSLIQTRRGDSPPVLWVGTARGLARFDGASWQTYSSREGLLNESIQCLHSATLPDGRTVVWAGTDGGGAFCIDLDDPERIALTLTDATEPRLPNNTVYKILSDAEDRLYMLTNKGVVRLTPTERSGGAGRPAFDVFTFTVEDGLPLNQCNRNAGMVDHLGRIWVGTVCGAAVFDPGLEARDYTPKPLLVQGTIVQGKAVPQRLQGGASLAFNENNIDFEYALLSFFRQEDTRYRAQLVGFDAQPSEWSADFKKEYRRLTDGNYVFRVWGRDYAGNVKGPVEVAFTIRPAPWATWWAYALLAALGVGLLYAGFKLRLQAHQRREDELMELVDARTRQLQDANRTLLELSYLDPLTGIANRRQFDERIDQEWKRAVRAGTPLAMIMVDIDWFKDFNDTYGHQAGDACLKSVATAMADGLSRAGDSIARYGGEEFAVILPLTDLDGAVKVADHLRRRVEALSIANSASKASPYVTVSCGVTSLTPSQAVSLSDFIRLSDYALYQAKQAGRNRTMSLKPMETAV